MSSYSDILIIEIELLSLDKKGQKKIVKKIKRELDKKLDKKVYTFKSSQDYLIIEKMKEIVERYEDLI